MDLVTGKCRPGKVSTSPLTLDMTVMCTPEPGILQPGAAAQGVLPPETVTNTAAGFDTSTPAVATPAPVVGQPEPQAKDFPTLWLRLASLVRTVVLVFLTHAAVGHSRGLVAFFLNQQGEILLRGDWQFSVGNLIMCIAGREWIQLLSLRNWGFWQCADSLI